MMQASGVPGTDRGYELRCNRPGPDNYSIRSIANQIQKFNAYTDAQVENLFENNRSIPTFRLFVEFPVAFFKAYIFRL